LGRAQTGAVGGNGRGREAEKGICGKECGQREKKEWKGEEDAEGERRTCRLPAVYVEILDALLRS